MRTRTLYLFSGTFGSLEAAQAYCQRDWGTKPDDSASDAEIETWENEFPMWKFQEELDVYLDEDFIELHFGPEISEGLELLLAVESERIEFEALIQNDDTLVVLDENALDGFPAELKSTSALRYLGEFRGSY